MKIPAGLLFLFLTCAKTRDVYNGPLDDRTPGINNVNIDWLRSNARFMHIHKREALIPNSNNSSDVEPGTKSIDTKTLQDVKINQTNNVSKSDPKNNIPTGIKNEPLHDGLTEGGIGNININQVPIGPRVMNNTKPQINGMAVDTSKGNNTKANETLSAEKTVSTITNTTINSKSSEAESAVDINGPGVVKRALIVFGGFAVMAVAYFIFYRKKNKKYDSGNTHNSSDTNQFRYGVLQSDDRRDNLELSRIPLTMESDEDEDDLEIFDLEQKKKSLSYVNLQTNDEDIVLNGSKDESKNNLLLDIEDGPSDTLINWSSNGSKSIL